MALPNTAIAQRYGELGFRVIEGGKSRKIAVLKSPAIGEIFGLDHKNVLRDIRKQQEKLGSNLSQGFSEHCRPSTYRAGDGKDWDCFELTKVGFNTISAKYDDALRFLLALAFDTLECGDDSATIVQQINQRIRELRTGASSQNELAFDSAAPAQAEPASEQDEDEIVFPQNRPETPHIAVDTWADQVEGVSYPIRRVNNQRGQP